ncbi:MAG: hypothetical protein RIE06_04880 [Roseibium album]|uniref:Inner membrane protein YidI n=1 Tax=Roseibium album TaxID=311410 RepID=A0A0M6ZIR7_9HYPH|nr:hypothetical protein [Roseibium album]MBG6199505.1 hypothetical protein [Labrenzia sp. EL_13]MCR9059842.1 hypothetical protein [Paracoccaceae bacterium]CTQ62026.1 Inner membrane protein YidI [Roseibium album]CTQ78369.1 Inner membrane protein YidI [Roseibium album]CTQ79791.1 Inner membrane protein YidI [Roseibium album]
MREASIDRKSWSGLAGIVFGAVALVLALFLHSAGPIDPQPTIGQSIGEIAADIRESALRGLKGEPQPEPQAQVWGLDRILQTCAYVLAGIAIVLGVIGFVMRENRRVVAAAVGLGGLAIGFQLFVWTVMIIAGVIIIGYILANLGDILGGITGG